MKLLRSFSFRLAAIYALLFSTSLALLLGTYQLVSITWPRNAVREALQSESDGFAAAFRGDRHALALQLEARAGAPAARAGFHLLADPEGRTVSTNLPSWPAFAGPRWRSIEADIYRDGDEDDHEALVLDRRLSDGSRLMIGRDVEELDDLEEAIAAAALYLVGATLILATLGALLMNWAIGRRLGAVSGAARRVMAGDLAGRVPLSGSGDEFDRLAATLNLMLDRVEAGIEAVRTASDSVAHELRTPLTRLQASLRRAASGGGGAEAMAEALDEADRLQSLFDAVLRISRIESGRHEAQFGPVDISELVRDAAELYAPAAEENGLRLSQEVEAGLTVAGDRDLLFQAVANLVDNAIKFTPAGGEVRVGLVRDGSGVRLEVGDTGPGVPEGSMGRMAERFFRTPAAAGVAGFGLGLSLVTAIARLHGATLEFRSGAPGLEARIAFPAKA
ncbi:MAG TPA: ATP-binding protein [Allosphingosinicella sp.]|nr:ATP-binding protein [Allosphingosinicella sp.]